MKRHLITILLAAVTFTSVLAQNTQRFTATKANEFSIVYSLPLTVIDITVVTRKITQTPGEFYQYAKRILNVNNPIIKPSVTYSIEKVIINTHGVPGTDRRYAVKFGSGFSPYIILSPDNIPLSVNTDDTYTAQKNEIPLAQEASPTPLQNPAAQQVVTEDMLRSSTALKKAQLAAEQLYSLRQSRTDLITGQADQMPPDGQSTQLILDNLNAQEAALTAMFLGTTQESTQVHTFTYIPPVDTLHVDGVVIARLSQLDGIVAADDLSGAPIYLDYNVTQQGEMPLSEKGQPIPFPKNGLAYCIPGKAQVRITYDGDTEASATVNVAQAGIVYGLDPKTFYNKKATSSLVFDPATGALVSVTPVN